MSLYKGKMCFKEKGSSIIIVVNTDKEKIQYDYKGDLGACWVMNEKKDKIIRGWRDGNFLKRLFDILGTNDFVYYDTKDKEILRVIYKTKGKYPIISYDNKLYDYELRDFENSTQLSTNEFEIVNTYVRNHSGIRFECNSDYLYECIACVTNVWAFLRE